MHGLKRFTVAAAAILLATTGSAVADEHYSSDVVRGLTVDMSIGLMNGEANEYVYNPDGSTLSFLNWTFDNVVVLNGGIAYKWRWLTLGAKGRINLSDSSTMDDFDFPGTVCGIAGPFCRSNHTNTEVKHSIMFDVHAAGEFYNMDGVSLAAVVGYKYDNNSWVAIGGTSNYIPVFPNIPVISYEQWWKAPYIGLQASLERGPWSFDGRVIASWWVNGRDEDNHHLRTLLFKEKYGSDNDMVAVNLKAGYAFRDDLSATLAYDYERISTAKGPTSILNYATNATSFIPGDAAGGSSLTHTVSIGLKYKY